MKTLDESLLDIATQRLVAEFQPEQIYLFGSHAWGTPNDDRDVDLMVIVPDSEERSIKRMQRAHRCLRGMLCEGRACADARSSGSLQTPSGLHFSPGPCQRPQTLWMRPRGNSSAIG